MSVRLAPPEELLKAIPRPERYRPVPRVLRIPELRERPDGAHEIRLSEERGWRKVHPMIVALHRELVVGAECDIGRMTDVVVPLLPAPNRGVAEAVARSFLMALREEDYVAIDFEEPPKLLGDRYERVKELGRGGVGVAHLCRDRDTGALVVVKHAWGWSRPIERAEATNRYEADVLGSFDHPRIPPLLDAFEVDGILHMVRPYAKGAPLGKTAPRPWERPLADRVSMVRALAEVLGHVHERGFLYLDMKPANAVIDTIEEGPYLLDFGVVRRIPEDGVVRTRGIVGSKGYIAPEMKKRTATVRSDVFSLGRTWYQLATGRKPRAGRALSEYEAKMRDAGLEAREMAAILHLIQLDPALRPASMEEVIRMLPA